MANHQTPLQVAVATGSITRNPSRFAGRGHRMPKRPPLPEMLEALQHPDDQAAYADLRRSLWWLCVDDVPLMEGAARVCARARRTGNAADISALHRTLRLLGKPADVERTLDESGDDPL